MTREAAPPTSIAMDAPVDFAWEEVQRSFLSRTQAAAALERGTIVVLPSITFPHTELRKITAIQHYEERLLCFTLLLKRPEVRIVYVTSLPIDPAIVDYHLSLVGEGAGDRLHLVSPDDPGTVPLSEKLLRHQIGRA